MLKRQPPLKPDGTPKWSCLICKKVFLTQSNLNDHINRKYVCTNEIIVGDQILCDNCGEKFTRKSSLKRHKLTCVGKLNKYNNDMRNYKEFLEKAQEDARIQYKFLHPELFPEPEIVPATPQLINYIHDKDLRYNNITEINPDYLNKISINDLSEAYYLFWEDAGNVQEGVKYLIREIFINKNHPENIGATVVTIDNKQIIAAIRRDNVIEICETRDHIKYLFAHFLAQIRNHLISLKPNRERDGKYYDSCIKKYNSLFDYTFDEDVIDELINDFANFTYKNIPLNHLKRALAAINIITIAEP